jgi:glycosyltransferase involved in cell wall biosynthesis
LYANALGVCYLPFDEDYGYVTLEGMLSEKPVIVARDGGGATEFVEHGRDGLLVDPEPRAVADALDTLYSDRQKAKQMGVHARAKLQEFKLSWAHVVERIISAA